MTTTQVGYGRLGGRVGSPTTTTTVPTGLESVGKPNRRRWYALAAIVVIAAAVAAGALFIGRCDTDAAPAPEAAPADAANAAPAPEAAVADPTAGAVLADGTFLEGAPPLQLEGENFEQILRSKNEFRGWMWMHNPDPALVAEYALPECDCYDMDIKSMTTLRDAGAHTREKPGHPGGIEIVKTKIVDRPRENIVLVWVATTDHGIGEFVDSDGNVLGELPNQGTVAQVQSLLRGEDGRWRTKQIDTIGQIDPNEI